MKISEILRRAADTKLAVDGTQTGNTAICSCVAVGWVEGKGVRSKTMQFIEALGCDFYYSDFDEFPIGEIRQGARFLWLDFAALVAEDEGL